ncbi:MAG: hypothetical protein Ta2E_08200 [Mycoplasmoidaceae bacterium]|nr:MAG: hypothetical protein Ta2E_08200 [Mycoplasmoidaceae bacterium]
MKKNKNNCIETYNKNQKAQESYFNYCKSRNNNYSKINQWHMNDHEVLKLLEELYDKSGVTKSFRIVDYLMYQLSSKGYCFNGCEILAGMFKCSIQLVTHVINKLKQAKLVNHVINDTDKRKSHTLTRIERLKNGGVNPFKWVFKLVTKLWNNTILIAAKFRCKFLKAVYGFEKKQGMVEIDWPKLKYIE